jgi:hypothetical protein
MKNQSTEPRKLSRVGRFIYTVILPLVIAFSLLFVSNNTARPLFLGSVLLDFLARLWICIMFWAQYAIVCDLERYRRWFYAGKIIEPNCSEDVVNEIWNLCMGLMGAVYVSLISWWSIRIFLPIVEEYSIMLAILNGLAFFLPMFLQRKRLLL